jgi:hypothetical protein
MPPTRRDGLCLALLMMIFLAWHVPLMYRICPGVDEDFYGVVGITALRGGMPRIPYIPSRDPATAAFGVDIAVYTLPPLSFYLQALAHLVLGDGIGPARTASAVAGLVAVYLVYDLGRIWSGDRHGAVLGAAVFLFSRAFSFMATVARPDMLTTALGLLAIRCAARWTDEPHWPRAAAAGIAAGLALLAHPFGIIPAIQVGLWILAGTGRLRLRAALVFAAAVLAVFALWLPLIALHPDLFRTQFGVNVLNRAVPGLSTTSQALLTILGLQALRIARYLTLPQVALYAGGLAWAIAAARRPGRSRELLYHATAALVLLLVFTGRHPANGYLVYPAALLSIAVGQLARSVADRARGRAAIRVLVPILLGMALLPGSGIRVALAHLRHWSDPSYDARTFARSILADLPPHALAAVDGSYVMELFLAGRPVVDAIVDPFIYDVRVEPFEYAVLGHGVFERESKGLMGELVLINTYGDWSDPFAHHAALYRRSPGPVRIPDR